MRQFFGHSVYYNSINGTSVSTRKKNRYITLEKQVKHSSVRFEHNDMIRIRSCGSSKTIITDDRLIVFLCNCGID